MRVVKFMRESLWDEKIRYRRGISDVCCDSSEKLEVLGGQV